MKKIVNYTYKALDGKVFNTEEECIEYEKTLINSVEIDNIITILKRTRDVCKTFACSDCPINKTNNGCPIESSVPEKWCFSGEDNEDE